MKQQGQQKEGGTQKKGKERGEEKRRRKKMIRYFVLYVLPLCTLEEFGGGKCEINGIMRDYVSRDTCFSGNRPVGAKKRHTPSPSSEDVRGRGSGAADWGPRPGVAIRGARRGHSFWVVDWQGRENNIIGSPKRYSKQLSCKQMIAQSAS